EHVVDAGTTAAALFMPNGTGGAGAATPRGALPGNGGAPAPAPPPPPRGPIEPGENAPEDGPGGLPPPPPPPPAPAAPDPLPRARPGAGSAGPVPRGEAGHRAADRERVLLRLRRAAAVRSR